MEGRILFALRQVPSPGQDLVRIAGFGPEAEGVRKAQEGQEPDSPLGKDRARGAGADQGDLQDQVGPALQKGPGPDRLVKNSGLPPLDIGPAHDRDQIVAAGLFPCLFQEPGMALVEGIAFHYRASDPHGFRLLS